MSGFPASAQACRAWKMRAFSRGVANSAPTSRCPACCMPRLCEVHTPMRASSRSASQEGFEEKAGFVLLRPCRRRTGSDLDRQVFRASSRPTGPCWRPERSNMPVSRSSWRLDPRPPRPRISQAQVEIDFAQLPPVVSMWNALKKVVRPRRPPDEWGDNAARRPQDRERRPCRGQGRRSAHRRTQLPA